MSYALRSKSSRRLNRRRPVVIRLEDRLLLSNTSGTDVLTYHNDTMLSGANLTETTLTPANVNPTDFGKLFTQPVDGYVYAEPLVKTDVTIDGVAHDVVFVTTENDTVYAFDADSSLGADARPLWSTSFLNPAEGITAVPSVDSLTGDIVPVIGITGTPVIDGATNTLYVVAATKQSRDGVDHYIQTLHGLNLSTGAETVPGGYVIGDTIGYPDGTDSNQTALAVPGTGDDSLNGVVTFNALRENQRPALTLSGNTVLATWASHGDNGPYHGWLASFDTATLQPVAWFNTSPDGSESGIWQGGDPPAIDPATGAIYFATGNGTVDPLGTSPVVDYGESVVRLNGTPTGNQYNVDDYFTPYEYQELNDQDADFGSGGTMLLPDSVGSAEHPHLLVAAGKEGKIYLVDRDDMGELSNPATGPDDVVQEINTNEPGIWGSPTYLQISATTGIIYYHSVNNYLLGYSITNGQMSDVPVLQGGFQAGYPGAQPVVSADGIGDPDSPANAIVWELDVQGYTYGGAAILRAYDASNLNEVYDSNMAGFRDIPDAAVKFTVPTVANGHVYVGSNGSISVYGEFASSTVAPAAPTGLTSSITTAGSGIHFSWSNPLPAANAIASEIDVYQSNDGGNSYFKSATLAGTSTQYTALGYFNLGGTYAFEVVAVNQAGSSAPSNPSLERFSLEPSTLSPLAISSTSITLSWTTEGNDHFEVLRSADGVNYAGIASLPLSQTSYTDAGLTPGTYSYRIESFQANSSETSLSNIEGGTVGASIDDGAGFDDTTNLTANGSAQFSETVVRLTDTDQQTGSVFSNNRLTVGSFETSFTIRFHEGTQPSYSDGIAFVIQAESPTALGQSLGGLGYEGIGNSVAIKLDTYQNPGDPSASSTGLYVNGQAPIGGIDTSTVGSDLLINSQDPKLVTLSYDGTTLTETICDTLNTSDVFTTSYTVNIAALIGSDTAYVGFTGSTGDDDLWQLQDVTNWNYTSTAPIPGAPTNLREVDETPTTVDLAWDSNSFNQAGYRVERSQDGVHFTTIGTTSSTSFQDTGLVAGAYDYRVVAYNQAGSSPDSNTLDADAGILVDYSDGFADTDELALNGRATVVGSTAEIINGRQAIAGSLFTTSQVPINRFTTTFSFVMLPSAGIPIDNGMTFTIQDDPRGAEALGGIANSLGYGSSIYGGQPITNSVAIKFDAADNGQSSTGIYFDGLLGGTTLGPGEVDDDLSGSGFDFNAGAFADVPHQYMATLSYDGTTLSETLDDVTAGLSFTTSYQVNISSYLGSSNGYVGFTAGDVWGTSYQEVETWTGQFTGVDQATQLVVTGPSNPQAGTSASVTVTAEDAWGVAVPTYTGTVHLTSTDPLAILPADYTFLASDNGVHTFQVTLNTGGSQSITATDETTPGVSGSASSTVYVPIRVALASIAAPTPSPRDATVPTLDVTFSEPINLSSLTPGALTLTDNGGANLINGGVTLTFVSGDTYAINGLTGLTSAQGLYTLTINAADLQDQNGLAGTGSLSTSWLMDTTAPTSHVVNSLGLTQTNDSFPVTVSFIDPSGTGSPASGVSSVDLYVSINSGPFLLVQTLTFAPTASGTATFTFVGQDRTLYAFHSVAHDLAGNVESKSSNATEATTSVPDLNPPVTHVLSSNALYGGSSGSLSSFAVQNPSTYANGIFTVAWGGADPDQNVGSPTGSIVLVDVYVMVDGGAPVLIAQPAAGSPNANGIYSGTLPYNALSDGAPHTYSFYSVGVDDQQKSQPIPSTPDITFSNITYSAPLAVQQLSVEDGLVERSFIQYLDVDFNLTTATSPALTTLSTALGVHNTARNSFVELLWYGEGLTASSTPKGTVNLFNTGSTASVALAGNDLAINFGSNGITGLLTESGVSGTGVPTKSFGDGWYALGVDPTGNPSNNQVYWLPFFRLLGDTDGDGVVTGPYNVAGTDAYTVYNTEGKVGTLLNADVDGSGVVNSKDLTQASTARGDAVGAVAPSSFPQFQIFAGAPAKANAVQVIQSQVQSLLPLAIEGWVAAGLDPADVRKLQAVTVQVGDLGAGFLGLEAAGTILINQTAAGFDWDLGAASAIVQAGRVDLLTVLEHELGHVIGLPDNLQVGDLMNVSLGLGVRRTPSASDVATAERNLGGSIPASPQAADGGSTFPGSSTPSQASVDAALESLMSGIGDAVRKDDTTRSGFGLAGPVVQIPWDRPSPSGKKSIQVSTTTDAPVLSYARTAFRVGRPAQSTSTGVDAAEEPFGL